MECLRDGFKPGVVLGGRYQTVAPLNHGSFGMVFMAKDTRTNAMVAIKCLTKMAAASTAGFDLAIDDKSEELVLHRRLGLHPNIVNLVDSFDTEAHHFLVLEFCPRGDLYEAIRNGQGPLETEHVRRFMLELVDAVAFIHSKGIYHRDIKPENIFLSESGSLKLGDFGLATTEKWTTEMTVGSDRYMSPEQYDSAGAGYSPAQADIWAIGICLLNILFSRNPFTVPAETDPLFLDFSRDKQSLFDVFPSMSQDTYEVIVECMNLDPSKRSLVGARNALRRVVSFTTSDEELDDFCSSEHRNIATAHREPLRTPSIQSPQVDTGSFPWAKALQAAPQPIRKLPAIPDTESYSEDLFSKSDATSGDWCSAANQTPSLSSILDSNFGASMQSLSISRPPLKKVSPMAGSLPINMTKPRNVPAMSLVFGRKDTVSKSWSDMWDEDIEEAEEEERTRQLEALKRINSRTWSRDSKTDNDDTPRQCLSPKAKAHAPNVVPDNVASIDATLASDVDADLAADGFFFHEPAPAPVHVELAPAAAPPALASNGSVDKWAALGERRRAFTGNAATMKTAAIAIKAPATTATTFGFHPFSADNHNNHNSSFMKFASPSSSNSQHHHYHHFSPNHGKWGNYNHGATKDRVKEATSFWSSGNNNTNAKSHDRFRDWNFNWRREKRPHDFGGDIEWVGGWQEGASVHS